MISKMKVCFICFFLVLSPLISLSGCDNNDNKVSEINYGKINLNAEEYHSIMTIVNDIVIYSSFDNLGNLTYSELDISTGRKTACGSVSNHMLSNNSMAFLNNSLYFFVTTSVDRIIMTNRFYELNIKEKKLKEIYSESNMQTFNYLAVANNKIYSTKGIMEDSHNGKTYIESYDPSNGKRESIVSFTAKYDKREGQAITNLNIYNDKIYATIDAFENGMVIPYINIYSLSGDLIESIKMSEFSTKIFNTAIAEIKVIGDYIYISNMSNESIVGKIEKGEFVVIEEARENLFIAQDSVGNANTGVFYLRNSNKIYILDNSSGSLNERIFSDADNNYTISYITKDSNDNLLIYLIDQQNPKSASLYYKKLTDIQAQT